MGKQNADEVMCSYLRKELEFCMYEYARLVLRDYVRKQCRIYRDKNGLIAWIRVRYRIWRKHRI